MRKTLFLCAALPLAFAPTGAFAQDVPPTPTPAAATPDAPPVADQLVEFSADQVTYDSQNDVIAATGQVRMSRDGNYLAADRVTYYRDSGKVQATGNVVPIPIPVIHSGTGS